MNEEKQKVDKNLETWLQEQNNTFFPGEQGDIYKSRYKLVAGTLAKDVHNEVEKGAIIAAIKDGKCEIDQIPYLNNHGIKHVAMVIQKASELLQESECYITPYEGYLLLMAIQFHDVGNIWGRVDHEKKCHDIINKLGTQVGTDRPERRTFINIAAVHGGLSFNGSNDTISQMHTDPVHMMGHKIRSRLLASILRISDELADDSTRTASIDLGIIPSESKIYHGYSHCLHSVIVEKNEIRLDFDLDEEQALEQYIKNNNTVFLVDEIYIRTLKMYRELSYCMRFMRPYFHIYNIKVNVQIYPKQSLPEPLKIEYTLQETGYPNHLNRNICEIYPDLNIPTGLQIKDQILSHRSTA